MLRQPEVKSQSQDKRAQVIIRLAVLAGGAAVSTIGLYIVIYLQVGAWQILADAGLVAAAIVCLGIAWLMARRGRSDLAAIVILVAPIIAYAGGELVWQGGTIYNAIGAGLMIILAGTILFPRRWYVWAAALLVHLALVWVFNQFPLVDRYDIQRSAILRLYVPSVTAGVVLLALWFVARAFRAGTLRTRLLIAFTALSVLLAAVLSATSVAMGWQNAQRQVINQLESAATLKEREMSAWLGALNTDMAMVVSAEQNLVDMQVLLGVSPQFGSYAYARQDLLARFAAFMQQSGRFEELFMVDQDGRVVLSTTPAQEGQNEGERDYVKEGLLGPGVSAPYRLTPLGQTTLVATRPISNEEGRTIGLVAGRAKVETLTGIMAERAGMGSTGETYLVSQGSMLLTPTRTGSLGAIMTDASRSAIVRQGNGSGLYENYDGIPVIGVYHWVPEVQAALIAEQAQSDTLQVVQTTLLLNVGVGLGAALLAIVASLFVSRSIARPLVGLAGTARQVAAGNLGLRAPVVHEDEVGTLAQAFNLMTDQLQAMIGGLEQRVAERTADLEQRSRYLQAAAQVGRSAASILNADELIGQSVELIRQRFGLYFAGLYLLDEQGEWAVLRAAAGREAETGQQMIARGHKIRVGQAPAGMIGWSIAHTEARVALEAGEDAVRLATAELPETRSEAALPLRSRGRVLGALTVQSDRPAAFDPDTLTVLETMADQVAIALDNALLFSEGQEALEATRRAYGDVSRQEWARLVQLRPDLAFRGDEQGVALATSPEIGRPEMELAATTGQTVRGDRRPSLTVPIRVRGEVVGVLDTNRQAGAGWSAGEVTLLEMIAEQLGLALEGARLYQDTQRRAAQERLVGEVTARMRETLDIDVVLQTAVREMRRALDIAEVEVHLGVAEPATDSRPSTAGQV